MQLSTDSLSELILGVFTPPDFCKQIEITSRTFQRWNKDPVQVPRVVRLWLELRAGVLSQIHNAWQDWRINIKTGELISPYGIAFSASQIQHMNMAFNERDLLRLEVKKLRDSLSTHQEQQPKQKTAKILPFPKVRCK